MKRIVMITAIFLAVLGCREQEEKSINLGDYNHPDSTETGIMPQGPEISADSTAEGKMALDSLETDRVEISAQSRMKAE